jgi:hypothetical protein
MPCERESIGKIWPWFTLSDPSKEKKTLYHVSLLDLKTLQDTDVEALNKLLDYSGRQQHLLRIGADTIRSMISGVDVALYKWEVANPYPDNTFPMELLEPM